MYLINFKYGTNGDYNVGIEKIENEVSSYTIFRKSLKQDYFMYCNNGNKEDILKMLKLMFDKQKWCNKAMHELKSLKVGYYDTTCQTNDYDFAKMFHMVLTDHIGRNKNDRY